jgi:hypothetical protein
MTWYAAHLIEATKTVDKSDPILVFENLILIEAKDDKQALTKAKNYGRRGAVHDETLTLDDKPAFSVFSGVRKVVAIINPWPLKRDEDAPTSGTEISYSKFSVKNENDLRKLVNGDPITIEYLE